MNTVTFTIESTKENRYKIEAITAIVYDQSNSKPAEATTTNVSKPEPKQSEESGLSFDEFKKVVKKAKADFSEDFVNDVFDKFCVKKGASLGRRCSSVDEKDYVGIIDALEAGEVKSEEDDDFGDYSDDSESTAEINFEDVKTALKAYAKEGNRDEAKTIMKANGAENLTNVENCKQSQLKAIMEALL
jgi:hypothetical protein